MKNKDCHRECHKGWNKIIDDLVLKLENLEKDFNIEIEILQIKEKFGGLRFYYSVNSIHNKYENIRTNIENLIGKAEEKAYKTCEICGKEGKLRDTKWIRTLCEEHYIKK